jgi:FkbM family methyltransferase
MSANPKDNSEPATETLTVQCADRQIAFRYPNHPSMLENIRKILEGREYPRFFPENHPPRVMVDIGAHIGATALYFKHAYPELEVYCFEPSPENYNLLTDNLSSFPDIQLFPYGLFSEDREMNLYAGKNHSMENSVVPNAYTRESFETIHLKKALDEFERLNLSEISILKVDTEGCEIPILQDLQQYLPKTDCIHLEYHAEEDRLEIDQLLTGAFVLAHAESHVPHRGALTYLSKRYCEQFLPIEHLRISRPTPEVCS